MRKLIAGTILAAVALAGAAAPAAAQSSSKPPSSFPDADGDGATSLTDLVGVWEWRFSRMDKDKDGFLTEEERKDKKTGAVRIIAADADRDQKVSIEEIRAFAAVQLKRMDKNGDGKIDAAERRMEIAKKR